MYYFNSQTFDKDPFGFKFNWLKDSSILHKEMVKCLDQCSNKLFFWTAKKAIHQYIRYDHKVIILFSKSFIDRPGITFGSLSCSLNNIEEEEEKILQTLKNYTSHSSSYTENKAGVISTGNGSAGYSGLSLYKNHWIDDDYQNQKLVVSRTFETEDEARTAFEKRAVQLIKEDKYIFACSTYDYSIDTLSLNSKED